MKATARNFLLVTVALLIGTVWLRLSPRRSPIGVGVGDESKRAESVGISNAVALDSSPSSATSPAGIGLLSTSDAVDEVSLLSPSDEVRARKLADGYTLRTNLLAEPYTGIVAQTLMWTPTGRVTVLETGIVDDRINWTVGGDVIRRHNEEARARLAEKGLHQDVAKREEELRTVVASLNSDTQFMDVIELLGEPKQCQAGVLTETGEPGWRTCATSELPSMDFILLDLLYSPYAETNKGLSGKLPFSNVHLEFGSDGHFSKARWMH
ncbi:MAG: hypothetical protein RI897_1265 [Verrucomicrobiota bacterium]|jgi:hypothetical protein